MSAAASTAFAMEAGSTAPYPGLRPFQASENDIFFGRERHTDELVARLEKSRFLAVVGTSGSGKSSLVRAGLVPALEGGFLSSAGSHWKIVVMRPGSDAIESLAEALRHAIPPAGSGVADMTETTLRRSSLGLVEAIRQRSLPPKEHLLLVVDQFEEVFRYSGSHLHAEAGGPAAFVRLLLAAARADCPIHVLLTMRSDFLGECARFRGLAETVNDGLYLIPRMTRDQLRKAIKAPAASFGAEISPLLVEELLNGVEDNPDQLPVLQHALMRTWNFWKQAGKGGVPIQLEDYQAQGGVESALSAHADEVHSRLDPPLQALCKPLFQCLTERGADGREIRRPATQRELTAVCGAGPDSVTAVIESFRDPSVAFLTSAEKVMTPDSVIDISHESLIRNWTSLRAWVEEESESRKIFLRLSEAANEWLNGRGALWRDPNLSQALEWQRRVKPSIVWARCGEKEFENAMTFLKRSRTEQAETRERAQREKSQRKIVTWVLAGLAVIVLLGAFLWNQERKRGAEAFARQLAAESALELSQSANIGPSVLMAIESLKQAPVATADFVLRSGTARLPGPSEFILSTASVRTAAWSPDSKLIAVGSADGVTAVYDRKTRNKELELHHDKDSAIKKEGAVTSIVFDKSGDYLASAGEDGKVLVAPLRNKGKAIEFRLPDQVRKIVFGPSGRTIAAACSDKKLYLLDLDSKRVREIMQFADSVLAVQFSPKGDRIAAGSFDGQVAMLDPARATPVWTWHQPVEAAKAGSIYWVSALAFFPDGSQLAVAAANMGVAVFDARNGQLVWRQPERLNGGEIAIDPAGKIIAAANDDSTVRLLHAGTGTELARIRHQNIVSSIAFSADGRFLASASADGTARVRAIGEKREVVRVPHGSEVTVAAFSPDNQLLLTGSDDRTVRLTPTTFSGLGKTIQTRDEKGDITQKSSRDGRFHMKSSEADGLVIESASGERLTAFKESFDGAFSPDSKVFVHGGWDEKIVVAATDGWRVSREIAVKGWVQALDVSPDNRYVTVGTANGLAQVFELSSGRETARIPHQQLVENASVHVDYVSFDKDGRYLYTGVNGAASTTYRHALRKEDLIAEACGRVGRNMTQKEWAERFPGRKYQETCKFK